MTNHLAIHEFKAVNGLVNICHSLNQVYGERIAFGIAKIPLKESLRRVRALLAGTIDGRLKQHHQVSGVLYGRGTAFQRLVASEKKRDLYDVYDSRLGA